MNSDQHKNEFFLMWFIPALAPLFIILCSFVFDVWQFGLMDDHLILCKGVDFFSRLKGYGFSLMSFGLFRPIYSLHACFFYSIFSVSPKLFYAFKLFEVFGVMMLWSYSAYRITKAKVAIWLLPAATLSFHYFYDQFFFLSTQEILGLYGIGFVMLCLTKQLDGILGHNKSEGRGALLCALAGLVFAYGSKETFVSSGIALGVAVVVCWVLFLRQIENSKKFMINGVIIVLASFGFGLFLKFYVQKEYTSSYDFVNYLKLMSSLKKWVTRDFLNHVPWIVAMGIVFWKSKKNIVSSEEKILFRWGMVASVFLYGAFLLILLPWNTVSYYAAPFGLYFAFVVTVLIARRMETMSVRLQVSMVLLLMCFNVLVCQYALTRESGQQKDAHYLMKWLEYNESRFGEEGLVFLTNAMEAGDAIPNLLRYHRNVDLPRWRYQQSLNSLKGQRGYFFFSDRFGDFSQLADSEFQVEFVSGHWVVVSNLETGKQRGLL